MDINTCAEMETGQIREAKDQAVRKLAINYLPLTALIPYARNARTHSPEQIEQIAAAIEQFGWTNPILIDAAGGILAGHGRVMAAQLLGIAEAPCIELKHLSETERRAYILADNQLALRAGWDEDLLKLELADLEAIGFDLPVIGFSDKELEALLYAPAPLDGMPVLPAADKAPFRQMTFTLHDSQAERVVAAMAKAAAMGPYAVSPNENSNGNALARVCEKFLAHYADR